MKHYSASLVGQANQVDDTTIDSSLMVGANDSIEFAGANTSTNTGVGLIIDTTSPEDKYLRGDGQEAAITGLQLGLNSISALHLPLQNATADGYVDSQIVQSGVGTGAVMITLGDSAATTTEVTGGLNVGGDAVITGSLTVAGSTTFNHSEISTYADTYLELNVSQDRTTGGGTPGIGGILVEDTYTAGDPATDVVFGGWRFNGTATTANPNGRWEYNLAANADGSGGTWIGFDEDFVNSLQGGTGISIHTTGTIDGLTGTEVSPIVEVDLTATAIAAGTGVGRGGLQFDGTEAAGTIGIADNGVAESMLNITNAPTAGHILTAGATNSGQFTWVDPGSVGSAGSVRKLIQNITEDEDGSGDTADEVYTVDTTIANAGVSDANLGINLIVSVYEYVNGTDDAGGLNQVIPQSTVITGTSVTVTLPAGGFNGRIVITG